MNQKLINHNLMFNPNLNNLNSAMRTLLLALPSVDSSLQLFLEGKGSEDFKQKSGLKDFKKFLKSSKELKAEMKPYKGYELELMNALTSYIQFKEKSEAKTLPQIVDIVAANNQSTELDELSYRFLNSVEAKETGNDTAVLVVTDSKVDKKGRVTFDVKPLTKEEFAKEVLKANGKEIRFQTWNPFIGTSQFDIANAFLNKGVLKVSDQLTKNGYSIQNVAKATDTLNKISALSFDRTKKIEVYVTNEGVPEYFIDITSGVRHQYKDDTEFFNALKAVSLSEPKAANEIVDRREETMTKLPNIVPQKTLSIAEDEDSVTTDINISSKNITVNKGGVRKEVTAPVFKADSVNRMRPRITESEVKSVAKAKDYIEPRAKIISRKQQMAELQKRRINTQGKLNLKQKKQTKVSTKKQSSYDSILKKTIAFTGLLSALTVGTGLLV